MKAFWQKVNKSSGYYGDNGRHPTECWEWTGALRNGYGRFYYQKFTHNAHRFSWRLHNGPIQDELDVLHKCDNRKCIRLSHLFLGTNTDNVKDRVAKGRSGGGSLNGEDNPKSTLSMKDVKDIRTKYQQGKISQYALAREYGVRQPTISRIINNQRWKHSVIN